MKIEKIKNYNQRVLAVFGTLGVIVVLVLVILLTKLLIDEFGWLHPYRNSDTGILSSDKIEELQKENKRQQLISLKFPKLVDTLNQVYIIPVSRIDLAKPELINDGVLDLYDSDFRNVLNEQYCCSPPDGKNFFGEFINMIIWDYRTQKTKTLFDLRVNFNEIQVDYFSDDILVTFKAATEDTREDGFINLADLKGLYVYSLRNEKLYKVSLPNSDVLDYQYIRGTRDLIIQFAIDKNENGSCFQEIEPTIIKKYDYAKKQLVDIVDQETISELQKVLEGSK